MFDQIAVPALAAAAAYALYKNSKAQEVVENYLPQGMIRQVTRTVAPLDNRCMGYGMDGQRGYAYMGPAYTNFRCKNGAVTSGCAIPANEGAAPSASEGFGRTARSQGYRAVPRMEKYEHYEHDPRGVPTTKSIDVLDNQDFVRIENYKLSDPVDRSSLYNRPIQQLPFAPASKTGYGLYGGQGSCTAYPQSVVENFEMIAPNTYQGPAGMGPQVELDKTPTSEIVRGTAIKNVAADAAKNEAVGSLSYSSVPTEIAKQGSIMAQDGQVVDNVYMVDRTFLGVTAGGVINRNTSCPFRGDLYITPCPVGRMDPAQYSQLDGLKTGYIQFHLADDSDVAKQNLVQEILTADPTCTQMPQIPDAIRSSFEGSSGKEMYTTMY